MSEHDERLRELGTQLPWDRPDAARRNAVRSALLVAAAERESRPSTRWYVIGGAFAAGALAAAAAVLLFVHAGERTAPAVSAARIEASPAAQVERKLTKTPTGIDEVVRVRSGSLNLSVGALRAGDHVRVATHDAEVEGEGSYHVVVVGDVLQTVNVVDGNATIRMTGQQAVFLSTGESWRAKAVIAHADIPAPLEPTAPVMSEAAIAKPSAIDERTLAKPSAVVEPKIAKRSAVTPTPPKHIAAQSRDGVQNAPDVAAPPSSAEAPPVAETRVDNQDLAKTDVQVPAQPTGPSEVERRFQAGMALLKANKPSDAARELLAAADAGGLDPLAADARYFAAVALTKAGRKTEAERALVTFIDRAPKSIRRGRAAVMLARLIAERGDKAAARAWFESALDDADASVVAAARAGIASLK
jgi:TolA-binding protein